MTTIRVNRRARRPPADRPETPAARPVLRLVPRPRPADPATEDVEVAAWDSEGGHLPR